MRRVFCRDSTCRRAEGEALRKLLVWYRLPFVGKIQEDIIEIEDDANVDEEGLLALQTMYENDCPGGWEIVDESEEKP